jgi:hypothetical protein
MVICDHIFLLLSAIVRIIHLGNKMANQQHMVRIVTRSGLLLSLTTKNAKVERTCGEGSRILLKAN